MAPCIRRLFSAALACLTFSACGGVKDPPKEPEPICSEQLADGTCVGLTYPVICHADVCAEGVACERTYHVDAHAGGAADGSSGAPFLALTDAAEVAVAGDCIVVKAGRYSALSLAGGVSLLGSGAANVSIVGSSDTPALSIKDGQGGWIRGLTLSGEGRGLSLLRVKKIQVEQVVIDGVREVGLDIRQSTAVTLTHVSVRGCRGNVAGEFGVGVVLADGSMADFNRVVVAESAAEGILVAEAGLTLKDAKILRNGVSGVSIACVVAEGCGDSLISTLEGVELSGNQHVSLLIRGATVRATKLDVTHTQQAKGTLARAVEVQDGASVEISESWVHHNQGMGILIDRSTGKLQGNRIEENAERGIWLQSIGQGFELLNNDVLKNQLVGIGMLSSVKVRVMGGQVMSTAEKAFLNNADTIVVGDGLQILDGSEATVSGVHIGENDRVALLVDASTSTVRDCTLDGGEAALIVQNALISEQSFVNNQRESGAALQPVSPQIPYAIGIAPISVSPLPLP
ncbi:MAG: right-handed parallel beta-helix repeat-containing protein [Deltaproteobacteria bacterium]|nr:right-handed parallel beta-helix repeat-containing protein [Deltaproteobacteria bacterium]